MKSSAHWIAAAACGLALATSSSADTLALYTFDSVSSNSTASADSNDLSIASSLSAAAGTMMIQVASTSWSADPVAAMNNLSSDRATAISGNDYWEFTLSVDNGYTVSLGNLSLNALLNDNVGSGYLFFQYKLASDSSFTDVGNSSYSIGGNFTGATTPTSVSISLAATTFQELDEAISFRVYGVRSSGSIRIDDVTLNGTVTAIPEPSSFALLASLTTLGCVAARRRR